jgi:hypothetical protein
MPTQYIKTLGALTINDGNPDNSLDIRTGGSGAITINGQAIGGGGGGGGDVYLAGGGNVAGAPQTFGGPILCSDPAGFVANDPAGNIQSHGTVQARNGAAAAGCEIKADGTADCTSTVKGGSGGALTDVAFESKGKITSDGDIEIPVPAPGFVGQAKIEASTHSITCRDLTAARDFAGAVGGQITCNELVAEGTAVGQQKIRCNNDFGEMISAKYVVGTNATYLNKVSLEVRNSAAAPIADRKSDLVFNLPLNNPADPANPEGAAEIFFENNEPLSGGSINPAYQRLCKIEEQGFVACRPIRYLALQPITGASPGQPSYAYAAEVYDVYTNAGAGGLTPSLNFTTRLCNDLTNDVAVAAPADLQFYTMFQMTSSTAAQGNAAFPDAGFQSKYPAADGDANDIITWNVGEQAGDPGVNNFLPDGAGGFIDAFKRKHWRISFKQVGSLIATVAVPTATPPIGIGDTVLQNYEGYIDVCIAEFPTDGAGEFQYKQVCYGTSVNRLQSNAVPSGSRTESRGQARMARRNQFAAGLGAWQFMLDFPSWDLTSIGGANNAAVTMTLNFTFTCLQ